MNRFIKLLPIMLLVSIGNDIAITAFLNPLQLNAGGATGLAVVLSTVCHLPMFIIYGLLNIPIFLFGARYLSVRYSLFSLFTAVVTTLLFPYLEPYTVKMLNPLTAAVIASIIYGISVGLSFRYDFSLGGFALLAKIFEVVFRKKVGTIFTIINLVPIALAFIMDPSFSMLIGSVVFTYLTGVFINWTVIGRPYISSWSTKLLKYVYPGILLNR